MDTIELKRRVDHFKWLYDRKTLVLDNSESRPMSGIGVSKSALDKINKSIDHYFAPRDAETAAMAVGTAFHTLVLEPEKFNDEIKVGPIVDKRTAAGKKQWKDFEIANKDSKIITQKDWDMIQRMRDSVMNHPLAADLLDGGEPERTIIWNDLQTDILMKGRVDMINSKWKTVIDLKSTSDGSISKIEKDLWSTDYRYNVQATIYADGIRAITGDRSWDFHFVFVEKKPPYGVRIVNMDEKSFEIGRTQYHRDLLYLERWYNMALESLESGKPVYHGYSDEILKIEPPAWLVQKIKKGEF